MPQFGFAFDPLKCAGCHSCAIACKAEMNTPIGVRYRRVVYRESGTYSGTGPGAMRREVTSVACFHCARPACVNACPTGALSKEADLGVVLVDGSRCVGCRRCAAACPYGAHQFNRETRRMEKCNACWHRIVDTSGATPVLCVGVRPACVAACPARALRFAVRATWGAGTAPTGFYDRTATGPSVDFE